MVFIASDAEDFIAATELLPADLSVAQEASAKHAKIKDPCIALGMQFIWIGRAII